ncbi:MAG: hypothetical protein FWE39_16130, partial [Nocardiaceae bacterium]|nr:hypothetical protein [Nocardiaceae bacterium]
MDSFWSVVGTIFVCFLFGAYLVVLFLVFADLFRDHRTSGWAKALWVVFLLVVPFASTLIYVIINGDAMAHRTHVEFQHIAHEERDYAARIARGSRAHQIHEAKEMLDAG